jgi:predicted DNA-binding transcriptional regulator AlpA
MKPTVTLQPAGLAREDAAAYVGLSVRLMEAEAQAGRFPRPRQIGARRVVWLREELDAHLRALPVSNITPGPGRQPPAPPADQTAR